MRLPKYLVIFGQKVKVEYAPLDERIGGLYHSNGVIQINKFLPKEMIPQVLLHEVFHAVIARCSLDQRMTLDLEEIVVDLLSKALTENFEIKVKK